MWNFKNDFTAYFQSKKYFTVRLDYTLKLVAFISFLVTFTFLYNESSIWELKKIMSNNVKVWRCMRVHKIYFVKTLYAP